VRTREPGNSRWAARARSLLGRATDVTYPGRIAAPGGGAGSVPVEQGVVVLEQRSSLDLSTELHGNTS
jgi:hypothetical protein